MAIKKEEKSAFNEFLKLVEGDKLFYSYIFFGGEIEEILDFSKKTANFLENNIFEITKRPLSDFSIIYPNEKGNIGIDEIRSLQGFLYQTPVASKKRTAVIFGAQNLTNEAQSALLKIFEEPPPNSLIILICNEISGLMPTISSRAHKIYFPRVSKSSQRGKIKEIGEDEDSAEEKIKKILLTLKKNPIENANAIKEVLNRLKLIKSFNLNNKLQLRFIHAFLKRQK